MVSSKDGGLGLVEQGEWIPPSEAWPGHSRPLAQAALARARKAGWWCKKARPGAKPWGVITCGDPSLVPKEHRCSTSIMSTSKSPDGSATAEFIDNLLRKCTHPRAEAATTSRLEEAELLVAKADRCCDVAEDLLEAGEQEQLSEDFLEQSALDADRVDELLDLAVAASDRVEAATSSATQGASELGMSTSLGPERFVEVAERDSAEAARGLPGGGAREIRMLRERCDEVRRRASSLRTRLNLAG